MPAADLIGAGGALLKWLSSNGANDNASDAMNQGFAGANSTIRDAGQKAMSYLKPFLEGGAQDYGNYRNMVNSGYFQTPYGKSFTSQSYQPSGFSFSPSMGQANFAPWSPQGGPATYTPPNLPPRPAPQPQALPVQMGQQGQGPQMGVPGNQLQEIFQRETPQSRVMPTPAGQSPQNQGLMGWNPQSGQGNPLVQMGVKPQDPKVAALQDFYNLMVQQWRKGGSGPLEGGMPGRGSF